MEKKRKRIVYPKTVAQAPAERGGWQYGRWMSKEETEAAEKRWALRSYAHEAGGIGGVEHQCGGCRTFAAFGADYGVCCNAESRFDGMIVFKHGGCLKHSVLAELSKDSVPLQLPSKKRRKK